MVREEKTKQDVKNDKDKDDTYTVLEVKIPPVMSSNMEIVAAEDNRTVNNYLLNALYQQLKIDLQRFGFVNKEENNETGDTDE